MKNHNLKSYSSTFVAYLISNLTYELEEINAIILYGSVAKGEATSKSDVDIFVDTKSKKVETKIKKIVKDFYATREAAIFKVKGIDNELSVKVGELKKWKDLHQSIMGSGFILWGRYEWKEIPSAVRHMLIFSWEKIGKNRGAFLNRLYGFSSKGKKHEGLLPKIEGRKLGKSSIIIPMKYKDDVIPLFKKYNVKVRQLEVFVNE